MFKFETRTTCAIELGREILGKLNFFRFVQLLMAEELEKSMAFRIKRELHVKFATKMKALFRIYHVAILAYARIVGIQSKPNILKNWKHRTTNRQKIWLLLVRFVYP